MPKTSDEIGYTPQMLSIKRCCVTNELLVSMVIKVSSKLRVLPKYSLQGRLSRPEYYSPRLITPRVISAQAEYSQIRLGSA
ncbi:hypothetical protein Hanom_Chr15g01365341 [Helianthus anomalus]